MAAIVADVNPKTLDSAKRQFVEVYGSALVMNTYLKIALVLISLVALGLVALNFRTAAQASRVKPLVIRIDEVGRAEAVQYDALAYRPQARELRYFLTQFVVKHFSRIRSTVESRSIPIVMKRKTKTESIDKWRQRDGSAAAETIRTALTACLRGRDDELRRARPLMPDGLSDRAEDVLESLFAIADQAGEEWPTNVRAAAVALMGTSARAAREADHSLPLELLIDLRQVFDAHPKQDALPTKTILEGLIALEDRPWATFGKSDKPITAHRLARLLKGFEIQPAGTIRQGEETYKGYRRVSFTDAFSRYLGSEASHRHEANKTAAEMPKTEASHDTPVTLSKTAKHPDKHWVRDDVTLSTLDQGDQDDEQF